MGCMKVEKGGIIDLSMIIWVRFGEGKEEGWRGGLERRVPRRTKEERVCERQRVTCVEGIGTKIQWQGTICYLFVFHYFWIHSSVACLHAGPYFVSVIWSQYSYTTEMISYLCAIY